MPVTQRGRLTEGEATQLAQAMETWQQTQMARAKVRALCVRLVERASFREVSEMTGFSTNTLQRWKREAK